MEANSVCVTVVCDAGAAPAALPDPGAPDTFKAAFVGEDNRVTSTPGNGHQHARFWKENSRDLWPFSNWGGRNLTERSLPNQPEVRKVSKDHCPVTDEA